MVKANRKSRRAVEQKISIDTETVPRLDLKVLLPVKVTQLDLAFPARALPLMPPMASIPKEFRGEGSTLDSAKWRQFQTTWFFKGLAGVQFGRREGIDAETAFRHLSVIQGSFEPKHEHKQAAVAYLASLWFTDYALPEPEPKEET